MALKQLYFKHDFNARNNPKLAKLKKQFGIEGIGIYWCLIEILYENNGKIKVELLEDLLWSERIDVDKAIKIMDIVGFTKVGDCYLFESVNQRINEREEYCNMQREKANKRWQKKKETLTPDWYPKYQEELEEKLKNQKTEEVDVKEINKFFDNLSEK